ncbi:MAG: hypothetical protein KDK65_00800 [Chlamydiia bacterium]|nr:hypothetical protein [Chlamydiia bacterium]
MVQKSRVMGYLTACPEYKFFLYTPPEDCISTDHYYLSLYLIGVDVLAPYEISSDEGGWTVAPPPPPSPLKYAVLPKEEIAYQIAQWIAWEDRLGMELIRRDQTDAFNLFSVRAGKVCAHTPDIFFNFNYTPYSALKYVVERFRESDPELGKMIINQYQAFLSFPEEVLKALLHKTIINRMLSELQLTEPSLYVHFLAEATRLHGDRLFDLLPDQSSFLIDDLRVLCNLPKETFHGIHRKEFVLKKWKKLCTKTPPIETVTEHPLTRVICLRTLAEKQKNQTVAQKHLQQHFRQLIKGHYTTLLKARARDLLSMQQPELLFGDFQRLEKERSK